MKLLPRLTLRRKRALWGMVFTLPFTIGFLAFFVKPMYESVRYCFHQMEVTQNGFNMVYIGWDNFRYAFRTDPEFMRLFTETVIAILTNIPTIIIFSFFAATVLNQEFRGRGLARVIFFLPVILRSGIIAEIEASDRLTRALALNFLGTSGDGISVTRFALGLFRNLRIPVGFVTFISAAVGSIGQIISASAIPIIIFLAGLQSIPDSFFEASKIEGATKWESFWKITFPLISPLFLTNIVYIIVDSFTAPGNQLVSYISSMAWGRNLYGVSVAMTWVYFGAIAFVLAFVFLIFSRRVFYMGD
ncbi:MAG: carbohydrate ABC transporter permease [Candidatus Wallacebacter cryptica]|nr:sugar ABC transporter permease [Bacillota bacterium]